MKYKTLFRLLIKFLGVWMCTYGLCAFFRDLIYVGLFYSSNHALAGLNLYERLYPIFEIAAGCYLFFDGRWIVDKAIPANHPYCPECAYDLMHNTSARCPECGTVIPNITDALP